MIIKYQTGGDLSLAHRQFPITKSLDIHTYYDPKFQPAKDLNNPNFGDIEYMQAKYDTLPYYNNYRKPKQFQHKSTIIYNDNLKGNAQEAIALDTLTHGLREQDSDWKNYFLPNLTKAWSKNDFVLGDVVAGEDDSLGNAVDGNIRNLLVQDKYRSSMRYSPTKQDVYKATVHTPAEKKAWNEAYQYITSNKLFPNGETLVVTPKRNYIEKHKSGGQVKQDSRYDHVVTLYNSFLDEGVNPQAALDLTNQQVAEQGWNKFAGGDGKRFPTADQYVDHTVNQMNRLYPDTLKAQNFNQFFNAQENNKVKYNPNPGAYKQHLLEMRNGVKKRINYYRSTLGQKPLTLITEDNTNII